MWAFYGFLHLATHCLCINFNKRYEKAGRVKQSHYRANIVGPIHALLSVYFAVLTMFYICGDGKTVFNNDICLNTPRYLHIWALVNTCGYFLADTFNIVVMIRTFDALDKQMIGHHVIALFTFLGTTAFMNWCLVFGVMLLFVEVSTTYISIRWLIYTHKMHRTACSTFNAFICFLTFFLGRLVF